MAARLSRSHSETVRQKIQASMLINRLHDHAMGKIKMNATEVRAAEILLDRSVPKLSQIQHSGEDGGPIKIEFSL
jgi:hypothetical protein